jgi:hypothetical protein
MTVEPFQPYHLQVLIAQGVQPSQIGQVRQVSQVPAGYASVGRMPGTAMTARCGDQIVCCGGVFPFGNIGVLWAVLSNCAGGHMLWIHRATQRFLEFSTQRRLEASVEKGFPQGCRWLELLGFKYEGEMEAYGLDGETHLRYARIRI